MISMTKNESKQHLRKYSTFSPLKPNSKLKSLWRFLEMNTVILFSQTQTVLSISECEFSVSFT